jgi:hypothetical protein
MRAARNVGTPTPIPTPIATRFERFQVSSELPVDVTLLDIDGELEEDDTNVSLSVDVLVTSDVLVVA